MRPWHISFVGKVAQRACDGLFRLEFESRKQYIFKECAVRCGNFMNARMFLLYQPKNARGINFLHFCQREGF